MKADFKILPLDSALFSELSRDDELLNAKWIEVDASPGYPCRVSLEDAKMGERVLAGTFMHHQVDTPYQSSGPIFVRENAVTATIEVNEVPAMLRNRLLSIRGYHSTGIMLEADVVEGVILEEHIVRFFQKTEIEYIHIHNAKPGCFVCSVVRA